MPDLSILIVNTQSRDLLLLGLDALARELEAGGWSVVDGAAAADASRRSGTEELAPGASSSVPDGHGVGGEARTTGRGGAADEPAGRSAEVLVLDNASTDGSAEAARAHPLAPEVIALARRQGKADSDSDLLERAAGRYGLLMNEDAELQPGALAALVAALDADPGAAAVGARLVRPDGTPQPSAWAFPSVRGALWALVGRPGRVVQSTGEGVRRVDWAQSAALLVRIEAARQIDGFDRSFFVYSDEVDYARRLTDAGWHLLWTPHATVVHHEQLSTDLARAQRRIVEFHRGRDRYLRKHHTAATRVVITTLTAATYLARAGAAVVLPGHDPARYLAHVRAAVRPGRGEGLREAADAFNAQLAQRSAG